MLIRNGQLPHQLIQIASRTTRFQVKPRFDPILSLPSTLPSPTISRISARSFTATRPHRDVLFVSAPLFKHSLLYLVRCSLILIPFLWRYKLFHKYPKPTRLFLWIPVMATSLVVALGLDQSDTTSRWRLLLMTEREEIEWSNQRFDELMSTESILLVPPTDPRIPPLKEVCDRLVECLHDERAVSFSERARIEEIRRKGGMARRVVPSATTDGFLTMPYRPETGTPEKALAKDGWAIFVIDAPTINAFVLASRDVFAYTGLLDLTEGDPDLLAAVISHEMIHVRERHIVESLGFRALSGVVFDVLRGLTWAVTMSFPLVGDFLSSGFTFLDRQLSPSAYSRQLELEADALGIELMAKAGYDPNGAIRLWEILNEAEEGEKNDSDEGGKGQEGMGEGDLRHNVVALLKSHPTGKDRLDQLKKRLPKAMKLYEEAKRKKGKAGLNGQVSLGRSGTQEMTKRVSRPEQGVVGTRVKVRKVKRNLSDDSTTTIASNAPLPSLATTQASSSSSSPVVLSPPVSTERGRGSEGGIST